MSKITSALDDAQLDAALDRLSAPVPSDTLTQRVRSMTPKPDRAVFTPRRTAAAVLAVAVAAAIVLNANMPPTGPSVATLEPVPIAAIDDPAGQIPLPDLELTGEGAPNAIPTEPFPVTGIPLE